MASSSCIAPEQKRDFDLTVVLKALTNSVIFSSTEASTGTSDTTILTSKACLQAPCHEYDQSGSIIDVAPVLVEECNAFTTTALTNSNTNSATKVWNNESPSSDNLNSVCSQHTVTSDSAKSIASDPTTSSATSTTTDESLDSMFHSPSSSLAISFPTLDNSTFLLAPVTDFGNCSDIYIYEYLEAFTELTR